MIEDKRRTNDTDFDKKASFGLRDLASPLSLGEMIGEEQLERLCADVLGDMSELPSDPPRTD